MESGKPQMSDLSMDEIQTAQTSAETPATETDYTAEMAQTYDRVSSQGSEFASVPNEAELTKYSDYNVSDELPKSAEDPRQSTDGVKAPASLNEAMRKQWGALPREAQQWISEREAQAQQKITEQGQQLSQLQRGVHATMPHLEHVERIAREL